MLFERHLRVGLVGHACTIAVAMLGVHLGHLPVMVTAAAGVAFPLTLLGAITPDLDEPNSRAYRLLRPAVGVVVGAVAFVFLHAVRTHVIAIVEWLLETRAAAFIAGELTITLAMAAAWAVYKTVPAFFQRFEHRGSFHQLPTGLTLSLVMYGGCRAILAVLGAPGPTLIGAVLAVAYLLGFASHLAADGLLSERRVYIGQYLDEQL